MRPMMIQLRRACPSLLLFLVTVPSLLLAADKHSASILVKDALTAPGQPVTIEAKLFSKRLMLIAELGGELLELEVDGKIVARGLTGWDGRAFLTYTPKAQGVAPVKVVIGNSPRVEKTEGLANLVVWEKRQPILMIELSSLLEEPAPSRVLPVGIAFESERKPMLGAADELGKLTQFYYKVIYVLTSSAKIDSFQAGTEARDWLKRHKFPTGTVLTLPADANAVGVKIDELHEAGWRTVKVGIGRSKPFAEAFLQRRLEAIMVPEPTKGDVPRKAKVAKDWKEVRKKL